MNRKDPGGSAAIDGEQAVAAKRHRRLLGLEPIFEGGWLHKGWLARRWDVEDQLTAVALFGDVVVDLSRARSVPAEVDIKAWAIFRDVDVTVPVGTHVELRGGSFLGHLTNHVPVVPEAERARVVRVHGRTLASDVNVRLAERPAAP